MSSPITATELRRNVYNILDEILVSGVALEVVRNGRKLLISPAEPRRLRLEDLPKRQIMNCTFDELVDTSWEHAWEPDL
jgi:hypothetical protein